jgi:hypothetical protein
MNTSVARYLLGVAALFVICGSLGVSAVALRRRLLPEWAGAIARLTEAVIGLAMLIVVLELLGTVGLFRLGPITAVCAALGAVLWIRRARRPLRGRSVGGGRLGLSVGLTAVALLAVAAVFAEWASPTLQAYDVGVHVVDSLWYHLPWAAAMAQTGHVTPLHFTDVDYLTSFYPATGEMLHGLGIVLLARDTLSPAFNLVWLALVLLAGYCVGAPFGRGAATLSGVALVMAAPMLDFSQPGGADNDVIGVFFLLASVALLLNGRERRPAYVLAAVCAGIAAGVKLTLLGPVLALTVGVLAIAPRGTRVRAAVWWLVPEFLAGGFWYVRNLIAVGNPLPWTSLGVLPTPVPPLQHGTDYSVAHYLTDGHVWSHFTQPALAAGLGGWWFLILGLAILGPLLCLLPRSSAVVRMLALVALASLGAYLVTPGSAAGPPGDPVGIAFNLRYAAPGLALALAVTPLAPVFEGFRRQAGLVGGLLAIMVATLAQPGLWPVRHTGGAIALGAVVLVVALLALSVRGRAVAVAAGVVALLVCAGVAAGYGWQRHYLRGRYQFRPKVAYLAPVWAMFRTIHDTRVGIVGTYSSYLAYPLFGSDDSNRVQYIARHGPHGSFTPIASCAEFRRAVNAARVRYLITTPRREFWRPKRLFPSPEAGWIAFDPNARLVYERSAARQHIAVFELRGPLDASAC